MQRVDPTTDPGATLRSGQRESTFGLPFALLDVSEAASVK